MDDSLKINEIIMPYDERKGKSKLKIFNDGFRFLGTILKSAAFLKLSRITSPIILALLVICGIMSLKPISFYIFNRFVEEWMIYRFIAISLLVSLSVCVYSATVIAEHMGAISMLKYQKFTSNKYRWWGLKIFNGMTYISSLFYLLCILPLLPALPQYLSTGTLPMETFHWSRMIVAVTFIFIPTQLWITYFLVWLLTPLNEKQLYLSSQNLPTQNQHVQQS